MKIDLENLSLKSTMIHLPPINIQKQNQYPRLEIMKISKCDAYHSISIVSIFHNNRKFNQNHVICEFFVSYDLFFHFRTITFFHLINFLLLHTRVFDWSDRDGFQALHTEINASTPEHKYPKWKLFYERMQCEMCPWG